MSSLLAAGLESSYHPAPEVHFYVAQHLFFVGPHDLCPACAIGVRLSGGPSTFSGTAIGSAFRPEWATDA